MAFSLPGRWRQQPQTTAQINRANPITNGLVGAYNFATGNRNIAKPEIGAATDLLGVGGSITSGYTASYAGNNFNNALRQIADSSSSLLTLGAVTHVGVVRVSNIKSPYGSILIVRDTSVALPGSWCFGLQRDTSTSNLKVSRAVGATDTSFTNSATTLADNKIHVWCAVCTGGGANSAKLYIDGAEMAVASTGSSTASTMSPGNTVLGLFAEESFDTQYGSDGIYFAHSVWNRALSAAEVASISDDPWQIYQRTRPRVAVTNITYSYSRPSADSTPLQWSRQPSGGTHFSAIDEVTSDPSDYLYALSSGLVDTMTCGTVDQPAAGTSINVNYTASFAGASQIKIELLNGATLIKSSTVTAPSGTIIIAPGDWAVVSSWPWTPTLKITSQ